MEGWTEYYGRVNKNLRWQDCQPHWQRGQGQRRPLQVEQAAQRNHIEDA